MGQIVGHHRLIEAVSTVAVVNQCTSRLNGGIKARQVCIECFLSRHDFTGTYGQNSPTMNAAVNQSVTSSA
jgi:hypothetical protein